jgi:hypothetical protein
MITQKGKGVHEEPFHQKISLDLLADVKAVFPGSARLVVYGNELRTLQPGGWLSDGVVEWPLLYALEQMMAAEPGVRCHVFHAFWFNKLSDAAIAKVCTRTQLKYCSARVVLIQYGMRT